MHLCATPTRADSRPGLMSASGVYVWRSFIWEYLRSHFAVVAFAVVDVAENHGSFRAAKDGEGGEAEHSESWFSQANHIFNCLGITSDFTDYKVVLEAFLYPLFEGIGTLPSRLFICLPSKRSSNRAIIIQIARLPRLLVPRFVGCWGANVYAALRQFHQAKGFDPDSQDVAWRLGYPLFQLPSAVDALFAHVDDADFDSQEDDQEPVNTDADGENHVHEPTTASEKPGPSLY
ncbi:hypothetical protein B0H14DRAFT_3869068 [Mycena olivaceomarginata]|nr:hypothetical protein B0H14DRAFT_3773562 [Mycena olivaceomarginata]KAJ7841799.1 hypothetical protein B0H14DRAFT_3869068 [Mycena olivaceomarginata]